MAKRTLKGKRKTRPAARRQKPTARDTRAKLQLLTPAARATAAAAQAEELREEFEKRKRKQEAEAMITLDQTDKRILELLLLHPKITQETIGDMVGLGRQRVNERINAAKFQRAMNIATRPALEVFEHNKTRAAVVLGILLDDPDPRVKIRAAMAHMWGEIHRDNKGSTADFLEMIREAYDEQMGNEQRDGPATATGTPGGTHDGVTTTEVEHKA